LHHCTVALHCTVFQCNASCSGWVQLCNNSTMSTTCKPSITRSAGTSCPFPAVGILCVHFPNTIPSVP
jgi:hypothetical protein